MSANAPSRQQRRQTERRLADLGRTALARGFPDTLDDEVSVGVALVLRAKLQEAGNPTRASEAAALAEQLLDKSVAPIVAGPEVACRRGCSHCCTASVSVTPPEIFRIAHWLRRTKGLPPTLDPTAIAERWAISIREPSALPEGSVPCPLLLDGACGIYPVRPLSCRQLLSTSEPTCRAIYSGDKVAPAFVQGALRRGMLARIVLMGAVKSVGLSDLSYQLSDALAAALGDPASETRWLAGADVFAGARVTERPASTQQFIDRTAHLLRG